MSGVPGRPAGAQSCRRLARAHSASWPRAEAPSSPERHTSAPAAHALAASLRQHLSLHELSTVRADSQQYRTYPGETDIQMHPQKQMCRLSG